MDLKMELQLFAEGADDEQVEDVFTDDSEEDTATEDEAADDSSEDDVSTGADSTEKGEDEEDGAGQDLAPYSEEEKVDDTVDVSKVSFTPEQRAAINGIVSRRVARLERVQAERLQEAAGIDITPQEVTDAMVLWGYLKANPEVSALVDETIKGYASENETIEPREARKTSVLALKEAILNLRLEDTVFNTNYNDVLDWAKDEGFAIATEKELRLAYKAWRADKYVVKKAAKTINKKPEPNKGKPKTQEQPQTILSGKRGVARKASDYIAMDDREILKEEGLSLFE